MSVEVGSKFLFHDARGERGPYGVESITPGGDKYSAVCRFERAGVKQPAWASEKWLRAGIDQRGVGWEPVA